MLRGLRYQKRVEEAIASWADATRVSVEFGPWFRFANSPPGAWRWCQPDIIIASWYDYLVILEVKLTLSPLAYWQLVHLYAPVVAKATGKQVRLGAIVQSYDPAVAARIPINVVPWFDEPATWLETGWAEDVLPVLQWNKPSRRALTLVA